MGGRQHDRKCPTSPNNTGFGGVDLDEMISLPELQRLKRAHQELFKIGPNSIDEFIDLCQDAGIPDRVRVRCQKSSGKKNTRSAELHTIF